MTPYNESRRRFVMHTSLAMGALVPDWGMQKNKYTPAGDLKQVVAAWPFMAAGPKWPVEEFLRRVHQLEVAGVELLPVEHWGILKKYNMICATTRSHTFIRGMNNKNHHPECFASLEKAVKLTSAAGFPSVGQRPVAGNSQG